MPGPVLFGFALDHSCLLWEQKCDGSRGACLYYDNHQMAWLLLDVCAACKLLNIMCSFIAWRMYVYKLGRGDGRTGNESTSSENIDTEMHSDDRCASINPALGLQNSDML